MSTESSPLPELGERLVEFLDNTKLSDSRILALLQRLNLRLLLLSVPEEFDLSTDWSQRLLHANLVLNCLTKFKNNQRLKNNAFSAANALKNYIHITTKGGVNLKLLHEQPVAAVTYSSTALCLATATESYKTQVMNLLKSASEAIQNTKKTPEFATDFTKVFCNATDQEMGSLRDLTPNENFENPLFFPMQDVTLQSQSLYSSKITIFPRDLPAQSFWSDWYKSIINGQPLDWNLQMRVANISKADWEKGAKHIGSTIEGIRKQWELENEITKLKKELTHDKEQLIHAKVIIPPAGRLHNQPPEAITDELDALRSKFTLLISRIEDLETEIKKNNPDPETIINLAGLLKKIALQFAKYCASLADTALQSTAKWAGPVACSYFFTNPDAVSRISKLAIEFAKFLTK